MTSNKFPIRRDALISPWGVGAIIPFPNDESLMVARLDDWFRDISYDDFLIIDERLSKRLGGKLLVAPPDYREHSIDKTYDRMKIPAVRFPLWHYCPVCGNMEKIGSHGQTKLCPGDIRKSNEKETSCYKKLKSNKKTHSMIPERFIAVCSKGHIEDFPIMEWVHRNSGFIRQDDCKLVRSTGTSSASLAGVRYTCTCGAHATMNGAFGWDGLKNIDYTCTGNQPWLGNDAKEECGEPLLVLQKGASNVWFADTVSSVYIPWLPKYTNENTKQCIARGVKKYASSRINGQIDHENIKKFVEQNQLIEEDIDFEQAVEEIIMTLEGNGKKDPTTTDSDYRKQEFDVLTRTVGSTNDELYTKNYPSKHYSDLAFLESISLVHKLRETRVFQSFRRISPETSIPAKISLKNVEWLPAIKNTGEGIMFHFDVRKLHKWASNEKTIKRVQIIEENLRRSGKLGKEKLNPVYVLLHTFSHCLITALSSESGYSNASIRERIYCNKFISSEASMMAGLLIYTASGDSEGSLGGLVRQGMPGRIEQVIKRAINESRWCAADPVCIQSSGQGLYGSNLSACHNCALLPETSCEDKNMFLDRGLLIGTLDDNEIGYFSNYADLLTM